MLRRRPRTEDTDVIAEAPAEPCSGTVTAVAPQSQIRRHLGPRVNVFIGGAFAFALAATVAERHRLRAGSVITPELATILLQEDREAAALVTARNFLSYRPRARGEVVRRLEADGVTGPTLDQVLDGLEEQGLLNDARFAGEWVQGRTLGKPKGSRALDHELRSKGVDKELIQASLPDAATELENALVTLAPYWRKSGGVDAWERRHKAIQYLGRRGYALGVAREAIARVEAGDG